mgnify:CR=1 FL=1
MAAASSRAISKAVGESMAILSTAMGLGLLNRFAEIERWLLLHNLAVGNRYAEEPCLQAAPVGENIPLRWVGVPIVWRIA